MKRHSEGVTATSSSGRFRRNIVLRYPLHLLPADFQAGLQNEIVNVTVEALEGIVVGDSIVETTFEYMDGKVTRLFEKIVVHS